MLSTLAERIHDNRFLRLIKQMLQAGYLEDWIWNATLSGAPQGGVVSPVLSNICMEAQERDELRPRALPQSDDRRIPLFPLVGELCCAGGGCYAEVGIRTIMPTSGLCRSMAGSLYVERYLSKRGRHNQMPFEEGKTCVGVQ